MKFPGFSGKASAVLVPVASLRSKNSIGCGEFLDLPLFAKWCKKVGLDLIQILPVNDTGTQSSPYSALSAHALNPIYISLSRLVDQLEEDGKRKFRKKVSEMKKLFENNERFPYEEVYRSKVRMCRELFEYLGKNIRRKKAFLSWKNKNEWAEYYSVFLYLKQQYGQKSWTDWPEYRDPENKQILLDTIGKLKGSSREIDFHCWLQYELEKQFAAAVNELNETGILLKGDLPILMNEDSVDVWLNRSIFYQNLTAGAPPDMFSYLGQNWGFPIYNWEQQKQDDFAWWRSRIVQADKFYHAYRIDHVLGFFRIWAINVHNSSGILGYFFPASMISETDLINIGFEDARIRWLTEPHIEEYAIQELFGEKTEAVIDRCFSRIGSEPLFLFSHNMKGEKDILNLDFTEEQKHFLLEEWRNRCFVKTHDGRLFPTWNHKNSRAYYSLNDQERASIDWLIHDKGQESERLWEKNALELLSMMNSTAPMLTCAEDLGVIPACVPTVLNQLNILGLKIPRWSREYGTPDEPFTNLGSYNENSVCALSVHDTSTFRGWWEKEEGSKDFWQILAFDEPYPMKLTGESMSEVLTLAAMTSSKIFLLQLQDILDLDDDLQSEDTDDDRVNIPGTLSPFNWTYRMPLTIEELHKNKIVIARISDIISKRREA